MKKVDTSHFIDDFIKVFPIFTNKELAEKFNVSIFTVHRLKKELRLEKDKSHFKRIFEERENKNGIFKKGNTPPLKGKKVKDVFSKEGYEKFKKIGFKKGTVPKNSHPIGTELLYKKRGVSIWYIKTELSNSMIPKHTYIYEKANGKIPPNKLLRFIDGDTLNCTLENLKLVSRVENMFYNSKNIKYPKELIPTYAKIAELNNTIKKIENGKN